jgi:hypothetical protein
MKKIYHVGILAEGQRLVIQARRSIDFLSPDILEYQGMRQTTKAQLKDNVRDPAKKAAFLAIFNERYPGRNFRRVVVD